MGRFGLDPKRPFFMKMWSPVPGKTPDHASSGKLPVSSAVATETMKR
jgi:hypothetical protein